MDDIRPPRPIQRRDYAMPPQRPSLDGLQPVSRQPAPQPLAPHAYSSHQGQPTMASPPSPPPQPQAPPVATPHYDQQPAYQQPPRPAYNQPAYQHQSQPAARPAVSPYATTKRLTLPRLTSKALVAVGSLVVAIGLFAGGYIFKSSSSANTIPPAIVKQAPFTLYFPSPMPSGYTYMSASATFQIGQVYYKFANGHKRVTVVEQPLTDPKPNLNLMPGYEQFDAAIGKAAIGTNIGETQAVVVTPTTVITMNTVGGVSADELKTAVDNLKNIGQNPSSQR